MQIPLFRLVFSAVCGPGAAQQGTQPDRRIGILLAAGDIAACYHKDRKYKEVADLIRAEVGVRVTSRGLGPR